MSTHTDQPMDDSWDPTVAPSTIRVSVAVVESDSPTRERLARQLGEGVTPFASIEELAGRLTGSVPVVVILGPSCATTSELGIAERLIEAHPSLGAVLVVDELTTTLLQQALRAGVRDVLTIGGDTEQFRSLRAVVSDEPLGMASIKEWITGDKRPHLGVISLHPEVTARQIRARRPGLALFSDGCADLFQSMFRQPPVGGQLAAEDIE